MEYSVYDLIRILLKRWYIILLTMCAVGGLSIFTAQTSYNLAVENYEASISETDSADKDTGVLTVTYLYDYELTDLTGYLMDAQRRAAFYEHFTEELDIGEDAGLIAAFYQKSIEELDVGEDVGSITPFSLARIAYTAAAQGATALLKDTRVLKLTQTAMDASCYSEPPTQDDDDDDNIVESDDPLDVSKHLSIENLPGSVVRITVSGLEELVAEDLLDAYLRNVETVGLSDYSITTVWEERESIFIPDPLSLSPSVEFAQVVLAKPEQAPTLTRTVGTAAAFAFVLSCFLILTVTFVKDSRRAGKAGEDA